VIILNMYSRWMQHRLCVAPGITVSFFFSALMFFNAFSFSSNTCSSFPPTSRQLTGVQ
jgi:hypothetical protein